MEIRLTSDEVVKIVEKELNKTLSPWVFKCENPWAATELRFEKVEEEVKDPGADHAA